MAAGGRVHDREGAYIVDAGCFVSHGGALLILDPAAVAQFLLAKAVAAELRNIETGGNETTHLQAGFNGISGDEVSCCCICPAKPGLWSAYAVCEELCSADVCDELCDEAEAYETDENSRVLTLVVLNSQEIPIDAVNPEFLDDLPWREFCRSHIPTCPFYVEDASTSCRANCNCGDGVGRGWEFGPLPVGTRNSSSVFVESGQIGIFCPESVQFPSGLVSNVRSSAMDDIFPLKCAINIWLDGWHQRLCELTCTGHQVGIMDVAGAPVGVVSASGIIDSGNYTIRVLYEPASSYIYACRIDFMRSN